MRSALACILALAALLGACSEQEPEAVGLAEARELEDLDVGLPLFLSGLRVDEEDITATIGESERPYLDAVGLWSLREEDDLLQATLQIGRFADDVDVDDEDFRSLVVTNIGTGARKMRMGEATVHMTGADRQTLAVWFHDRYLFILSTRDGFEGGRALLRKALEIEP